MTHIFISYARKNRKKVDELVARLQADGFDVWLDRQSIDSGAQWREEIVVAIDNAYAFLLALSPASAASRNVRKEMDLAEDSKRSIIPVLLARVRLSAQLRYQLAGVQWIEYFRKPELKYVELVKVLRMYRQNALAIPPATTKEVEIVIAGIDVSKFGPEKQEQLRNFLAQLLDAQQDDLQIIDIRSGSVHAFIRMPAKAAYRLKTAALNRRTDLIKFGIRALRFTTDRQFVFLKSGRIGSTKSGKSCGQWFVGGLTLMIMLLLSMLIVSFGNIRVPLISSTGMFTPTESFPSTPSSTPSTTETFTTSPSQIPAATDTFTPTPSLTPTSTNTFTPSPTETPIFIPSVTPTWTSTPTHTYTPTFTLTPVANLVPLYRWWSAGNGDNFSSTNENWLNTPPCVEFWNYDYSERPSEARIFSPKFPQPDGTIPLYSWYSCQRYDGLITTTWPGKPGDVRSPDYNYIRMEGYVYSPKFPQPDGTIPLYVWWSPSREDNFASTLWTGNPGSIKSPDYGFLRVEGYVYPP